MVKVGKEQMTTCRLDGRCVCLDVVSFGYPG